MSVLAVLSCGGDPDDPVIQEDPAPTAVTASPATSSLTSAAGEVTLAVTSPQRPVLSGIPSWITVKDGTYNKYNITFTLQVAENKAYDHNGHFGRTVKFRDHHPGRCGEASGTVGT